MSDSNWDNIIQECCHNIGQLYNDRLGNISRFLGVLYSDEDYYYLMYNLKDKRYTFLSCVGDLDGHEYTLVGKGNS